MAPIDERDPRFKYLETKIGIMVLVAILGVVAIMLFIGREKDIFTKKFTIHFVADSGRKLSTGMPVKLQGFKVGKIKDMELSDDSMVHVTLEVNRKYKAWVKTGTKAKLMKEGFIGEPFIELTGGDEDGVVLGDNDLVPFERRAELEELINEAKPVLNEIKEIILYANDPEGDIKTTLNNIRELTDELAGARHDLATAIKETSELVSQSNELMKKVNARSGPMLEKTDHVLTSLDAVSTRLVPVMERMDTVTQRAEEATRTLPETARNLNSMVDNLRVITGSFAAEAPVIRELITDAGATMGEAKEMVRGVKKSWPVRLMMPEPAEPRFAPLDAFVYGNNDRRDDYAW